MREGWNYVNLDSICQIIGGGTPSKSNESYFDGDIPWATIRDMKNEVLTETELKITKLGLKNSSSNVILKDNIIIATRVGLGKVCILKNDTAINQDLKGIIPKKDKAISKFLYWYFLSVSDIIIKNGTGATVQGVKLPFIKSLQIPDISLQEQQQIVAILDQTFEAIDQAKANIEKNIANAKELYNNLVQTIFEEKGDNWQEKTLKEVCEKITDGTHQTPKYFDEGIIFLSSRNVTSGKIDWNNIKYIDEAQHLEMHKRVAPKVGDILLAKNGTTGVAAMVDRDVVFDIYVSLAHIRVREEITPEFMLYFINSPFAKKQFNKRLKGTGVPNLHLQEIREVVIPFPISLIEQNEIVKKFNKFSLESKKLISFYEQKLNNLEELKKSILQKAFAGELTNPKGTQNEKDGHSPLDTIQILKSHAVTQ